MNEENRSRPDTACSGLLDVGKKAHEAGILDGDGELALILGAGAGDDARGDLAVGANEAGEKLRILVVNVFDMVLLEEANLATAARFLESHVCVPF